MKKDLTTPAAKPDGEGEALPPVLGTTEPPPPAEQPPPATPAAKPEPGEPLTFDELAKLRGNVDQVDDKGNTKRAHPSQHRGWVHACAMQRLRMRRNGVSPSPGEKMTPAEYDELVSEAMGVTIGGQPAAEGGE